MAVPSTYKIDYSSRDFLTLKESLINYIKIRFPKDYTDFSEAKLGMMLLELNAWVGDMLSYMIDVAANESYIDTCRQTDSVFKLAKLIGYSPSLATASSVDLTVNTQTTGFTLDCLVPAGTQISVEDVYFELLEDVTIPSSTPTTTITFYEGRSYEDTFISTGEAFQSFEISETSIISNSIEVYVNDVPWEYFESLVFAGDTNGYSISFTSEYGAIIRFGDGISGRIPALSDTIRVNYRVGGGTSGNVAALSINKTITGTLTDLTQVVLYVSNSNAATGGEDAETIDEIKINAPLYYRTHRNLITTEDYNMLISSFSDSTYGSVFRGVAVPRYGMTNSSANEVDAYIWVKDSNGDYDSPSQGLKEALLEFMNERSVLTVDIFVNDGDVEEIDVNCDAIIDLSYDSASNLRSSIESAIEDFFSRDDLNPGETFYISKLYEAIHEVPGVIKCNLGIPGDYKFPDVNDSIDSITILGLSTKIFLVAGSLTEGDYTGGRLKFTSGAYDNQEYTITYNGTDYVIISQILGSLSGGETLTLYSELTPLEDVPINQNEIYDLGTLTVSVFYLAKDSREVILITG